MKLECSVLRPRLIDKHAADCAVSKYCATIKVRSIFFLLFSVLLAGSHCSFAGRHVWYLKSNPVESNPDTVEFGAQLYKNNCIQCHGIDLDGNGPTGKYLSPKPANLIAVAEKKSTSVLAAHVAYGKQGSDVMPQFVHVLAEDDIWKIVLYLEASSKRRRNESTRQGEKNDEQ